MANFRAIHSVGASLVAYLKDAYQLEAPLGADKVCSFPLLPSVEIGADSNSGEGTSISRPSVSLYLYRITVNEHLRNAAPAQGSSNPPLPLDLHYLLTVWASTVAEEHEILGWVMHKLHQHQMLNASELPANVGFGSGDVIHVIPAELSNEDLMRIWEALRRPYSLSVSYIARAVRIDVGGDANAGKPVVVRRFDIKEKTPEGADG